jgi:hypothetical protein
VVEQCWQNMIFLLLFKNIHSYYNILSNKATIIVLVISSKKNTNLLRIAKQKYSFLYQLLILIYLVEETAFRNTAGTGRNTFQPSEWRDNKM